MCYLYSDCSTKKKIKSMNKILNLIAVFAFVSVMGQGNGDAKELLDRVSIKMSSYENVFVDFDYVLDNKSEDIQQEMSGNVLLNGEKYVVNIFGTTQIFDGSKTFTIIPENEEVNISDTDIDEANTFTPSKFFSFYKRGYTYKLDEIKKINGKQIRFVKLIPIDTNSEVKTIFVGIDLKDEHIYQIIENGKNGTDTILTAKNFKINQNFENDPFVFDENKYLKLNYIINK